jgi:hypothetical protein
MIVSPIEIFAAPARHLEEVRDGIETAINHHNRQRRQRNPLATALLESLQAGVNRAAKRQNADVAPLTRRILS